jgi:hypothetical protein
VFAIVLFQSDYRLRAHQAPCFARAARYASVLISSDIPMGADDDALTGLIGAGALLIFAAATGSPGSDASILPIALAAAMGDMALIASALSGCCAR